MTYGIMAISWMILHSTPSELQIRYFIIVVEPSVTETLVQTYVQIPCASVADIEAQGITKDCCTGRQCPNGIVN